MEQPDCLPMHESTLGCAVTGTLFSPVVQKYLVSAGEYHGPGPYIALRKGLPREQRLAVLLHEMAHVLPAAPVGLPPDTADVRQEAELRIAQFTADPVPSVDGLPTWIASAHGRGFTRISLHLWWRAAMRGEVTPLADLCGGAHLELPPCYLFWCAIGNEPVKMQHATFAEILATPEPEPFRDLWRATLEHWIERHPEHAGDWQ
jgi:hypothetical protein